MSTESRKSKMDSLMAEVDEMHIIIGLKDRIKRMLVEVYEIGMDAGWDSC